MKKRKLRQDRLEMVWREHRTALVAVAILDKHLKMNPSLLASHELFLADFKNFHGNLAATYFVRMFAEFESALREVWRVLGRRSHPKTADLINGLASRQRVAATILGNSHAVRKYRNALIHEDSEAPRPISVETALHSLNQFLSYLPADW